MQGVTFSRNFWTAVSMEFFERGAYYGLNSVLAVYLALSTGSGGLGFSKEAVSVILGTIQPLLYLIPIFGGAFADRFGYRRVLFLAFSLMIIGYTCAGLATSYALVFASLIVMALGAGMFKPVISGTIARTTTEENASQGFGIFYWSINLGACIFPLFLVPWIKSYSYNYVFYLSAGTAVVLMLMNIFLFREPPLSHALRTGAVSAKNRPAGEVFKEMAGVLRDWRFLLMIVLYSGFWVMYFQMYGSVLWYVQEQMDMTAVNRGVNKFLGLFMEHPAWRFDVEHVTAFNAGVIILLQLLVSRLLRKTKPLPTMCVGMGLGSLGMVILAINRHPLVFISGLVVFTLGEMTAHPKYNAYVGTIAPPDKKALYMGYSFLCSVIGSCVGGFIGAPLYNHFIKDLQAPSVMWLICACFGLFSIVGLLLYNRFVKPGIVKPAQA